MNRNFRQSYFGFLLLTQQEEKKVITTEIIGDIRNG